MRGFDDDDDDDDEVCPPASFMSEYTFRESPICSVIGGTRSLVRSSFSLARERVALEFVDSSPAKYRESLTIAGITHKKSNERP